MESFELRIFPFNAGSFFIFSVEKAKRLGGVLRCEEDVAFKKNLDAYLKQQEKRIEDANIDVQLNTSVTPELAEAINPDIIIAALGADPIKPLILGAGLVGVELGLHHLT